MKPRWDAPDKLPELPRIKRDSHSKNQPAGKVRPEVYRVTGVDLAAVDGFSASLAQTILRRLAPTCRRGRQSSISQRGWVLRCTLTFPAARCCAVTRFRRGTGPGQRFARRRRRWRGVIAHLAHAIDASGRNAARRRPTWRPPTRLVPSAALRAGSERSRRIALLSGLALQIFPRRGSQSTSASRHTAYDWGSRP